MLFFLIIKYWNTPLNNNLKQQKNTHHGVRCYSKGLNSSEKKMLSFLEKDLDTKHYYIFNNLILKTKRGSAQIDHLVVSPYGVFVIETKDYSGWIFGDVSSKKWTQTLPRGNKFYFQNPILQNYSHIKALQEYFPFVEQNIFKSIISFTHNSEFKTKKPKEVFYMREVVSYILSFQKRVLSNNNFFLIIGKLSQLCQSTNISPEEHIDNIKKSLSI